MKRVWLLFIVLFVACCFARAKSSARKRNKGDRNAISIGGRVVGDGDAAWQVSIMKERKLICGGTLLRNNVVLTAAECVKDIEPADLHVRAGTKSFKTGGQVRKVRETVHHPEYLDTYHAYNVGLLLLMRPFNATSDGTTISRVKLPDTKSELPSSVSVYGWGMSRSRSNVTMTKNLRFSRAKVYSSKKCSQFLMDSDLIENIFCSGDRVKRVDVCNDDLGSPAMAEDGTQFGVVSSDGACTDTHTTIYTNLKTVKPWIQETLREFKSANKDKSPETGDKNSADRIN